MAMKVLIDLKTSHPYFSSKVCARLAELGVPLFTPDQLPAFDQSLPRDEMFEKWRASVPNPHVQHVHQACHQIFHQDYYYIYCLDMGRADPRIIQVFEEMPEEFNPNGNTEPTVVEIPDGVKFTIQSIRDSCCVEYLDGEQIVEVHRVWPNPHPNVPEHIDRE